jgi:membrane protein implicated in regulation of membrane protease activity
MNIIFALVSVIIVLPIILLIPLRINVKQKLFLFIIALLISLVGITSQNLFPVWQSLLIMVALASLATILVSKRMPVSEVSKTEHLNVTNLITNNHTTVKNSIIEETKDFVVNENKQDIDDNLEDLTSFIEIEAVVSSDIEVVDISENECETSDDATLEAIFEKLQSEQLVAVTRESNDEELNLFEGIEELDDDSSISLDFFQPESSNYLSEIEKLLLEQEDIDTLIKVEKDIIQIVEEIKEPIQVEEREPNQFKEIKLEKLY